MEPRITFFQTFTSNTETSASYNEDIFIPAPKDRRGISPSQIDDDSATQFESLTSLDTSYTSSDMPPVHDIEQTNASIGYSSTNPSYHQQSAELAGGGSWDSAIPGPHYPEPPKEKDSKVAQESSKCTEASAPYCYEATQLKIWATAMSREEVPTSELLHQFRSL